MQNKTIEFSVVFLNQALFGLMPLVLLKLLSHYLTPALFGYYSLISSLIALMLALPFDSLSQGVIRKVTSYADTQAKLLNFIISSLGLYLFFVAFYLLAILIVASMPWLPKFWHDCLWIMFLYTCSQLFYSYLIAFFNGIRKRILSLILVLLILCANTLSLLVYFVYFRTDDLFVVFAVLTYSSMAVSVVVFWFYFRNSFLVKHYQFDAQIGRAIWRFSYPLVLMGVFIWLRNMLSRWLLDIFVDKEAVAVFSILSTLTIMVPTALQGILSNYYAPIFYAQEERQPGYTRAIMKRLGYWFLGFAVLSAIIVWCFDTQIVRLFSSSHYLAYAWMLSPMYFIFALYIISVFTTYIIFAEKRTRVLVLPNILLAGLSVISGFFLIKYYGLLGAFLNFIITYFIYAIGLFWLSFTKLLR